ncbi:hypothetical protein H8B09_21025 [Paenibacillus sp. PR3]|uniref:Uncharacterized protein n=1 Tax=Paenibacillus terricola TaxID=2763503 RepID=A0ABR8MZ89_9BACL|nr:hypothetical protein [Paenibacillus terricola]MBD3921264.1 hypothetical protein [Paenibacillus terricola]
MRKDVWLGWAGGAITLALIVVVAVTIVQQRQEQPAIADGHANNKVYYPELESNNEQVAAPDQSTIPEQPEEEMTFPQELQLTFRPLEEAVTSIQKVPSSSIPERERTRTIDFEDQTYWVYTKPDRDPTERFIGLLAGDSIYELGTIGGDVYEKDIVIDQADLFGTTYSRLMGICGADCAIDRYVRLENGIPVQNLYFNYHTWIGDWNHDGIKELVYSDTSIPVNAILVRPKDDQLEAVNLGELLQAKGGILYNNETNTFKAYIPFNDKPAEFVYASGDKLVQK